MILDQTLCSFTDSLPAHAIGANLWCEAAGNN
jgi:hypothetical protein